MCKHLAHPNIVPLLGITPDPLQLISEWVPGGDLTDYIKKHPGADRVGLVGAPLVVSDPTLTPTTSCLISLRVSTFSTLATYFMVILRGYVVVPNPVLSLTRV